LGVLFSAIDAQQAVRFQHRPSPVDPFAVRTVEPWGVVTARGRWYLIGHDRDRDATRIFRLSRITDVTPFGSPGAVATRPDGIDLRAAVEQSIGEAAAGGHAKVWVADGHATALRRAGTATGRRTIGGRDGDVVDIDVGILDALAREVTGYGADALVLEPESLRQDVLARLTAQAGAGS
jgi:proteasome accessory factor B